MYFKSTCKMLHKICVFYNYIKYAKNYAIKASKYALKYANMHLYPKPKICF